MFLQRGIGLVSPTTAFITCIMQMIIVSVNKLDFSQAGRFVESQIAHDYSRSRFGKFHLQMKKSKTSLPLENWVGYRFSLISARLGNFVAPMYASRHDLTMPAWRSLAVVARYQPLTASQLAMRTSSDAFKVARAIELLVRRGLIRRDVDQNDRRRASLRLTADGRKVYRDIEKFVVRVENELASALDANELAMLRQGLDKLERQLESQIRVHDWKKFVKDR